MRGSRWAPGLPRTVVLLGALLASAACAAGLEFGFEDTEVGAKPAGFTEWAPDEGEGIGTCTVAGRRVRTGSRSLRVEIPKGGYIVVFRFLPVEAGTNYLFRTHAFLDPGSTASANITIYWSAGPSQAARLETRHPSSPGCRAAGEWRELLLAAVAPPGATHAQAVLRLSGKGSGQSGVAHFDDVSLGPLADNVVLGPGGRLMERIDIPNARFDDGAADGLTGWRLEQENGVYAATQEVDNGNPAAKLTCVTREAPRYRGSLISEPFGVGKPVSHYNIRGRVRGRNAMCRLLVHVHDAETDERLNFWAIRVPAPSSWRSVGGTMRVLPRFRDRELAFRIELRLLGSGEAWIDDLTVTPADAPDIYWKRNATYSWNPESPLLIQREPAHGAVVKVNPPAFVFPPTKGAGTYRVELSRSPGFEQVLAASEPHANNSYLHTAPLDTKGDWFWRAVALGSDGASVDTGEAWSFRIDREAVKWPFPRVSGLAARVGPHPRLYLSATTLDADRRRVLANPDWPAYLARTDKLLAAEPDPEPVDYWDFDPWGEVYKHVYSPSSHMQNVYLNCAFAYLMGGDERFLNKAKEFMLAQAAWDPEGPTCFQWLDQVGRSIMLNMSIAYDWLYNDLAAEERATIERSLWARIRTTYGTQRGYDCRTLRYYPRNSHGITILGMMCTTSLALLHHIPDVQEIFEYVVPFYCAMFPPWGGDDGGWSEGVNYALWSVGGHMERWEVIRSALGIDLFRKPWYANAPWWRVYCMGPFPKTSWFGDGHPSRPNDSGLMDAFACLFEDPYLRWYADSVSSTRPTPTPQRLLRYRPVEPKPPIDIAQARAFHDVGWAFMHSDMSDSQGVTFGFKSSPHGSYSHSHADQNSVVLHAYGKSMAIDAGYYESYGSPHHSRFTRQTLSHNAILIDGKGQRAGDITSTGELTGFVHGPGFDFVSGQAATAYGDALKSWERRVLFVRPDMFVIVDDTEMTEPKTVQWLLHTAEEPVVDEEQQTIRTTGDGPFLHTQLLRPQGLAFSVSDRFDPPPLEGKIRPVTQYHLQATTTDPSASVRFVAVLTPCRAGTDAPAWEVEGAGRALVLATTVRGERIVVLIRGTGTETVEQQGLHTDAEMLALGSRGGTTTRLCMVRGTVCRQDGQDVLRCERPSTVSLGTRGPKTVVARDAHDAGPIAVRLPADPRHIYTGRRGDSRLEVRPDADGWLKLHAREWIEAHEGERSPSARTVELTFDEAALRADAYLSWQDEYVLHAHSPAPRGLYAVDLDVSGGGRIQTPWEGLPAEVVRSDGPLRSDGAWLTSQFVRLRWEPSLHVSRIAFRSLMPTEAVPARVQPTAAIGEEGRVLWEAETVASQARGTAKPYTHRTFLSNGTGLGTWTEVGHALTWTVDVSAAGSYTLVLKGSVWEEGGARRVVSIDGKELNGGLPSLFGYTDGFGAEPAQWRHFTVADAEGQELRLRLAAGRHTLTLTNYGGGMNLDYLALVPVR